MEASGIIPDVAYRFGSFELIPDSYALRCGGKALAAEPRVLEVLAYLLAHRDRVVSKDELLEEVWEGRFVGDAALSRAVGEVRRVLASGPSRRLERRPDGPGAPLSTARNHSRLRPRAPAAVRGGDRGASGSRPLGAEPGTDRRARAGGHRRGLSTGARNFGIRTSRS